MLLAIDTSTAQVGVALMGADQLVVESTWSSKVHHTVELVPAIAEILARGGTSIQQVEAVAVAVGPGSFTALRVGLAVAKGIAVALKIPIIGVPTLDVLAAAQPPSALPLAAVLQAGRNRIAVGWYKSKPEAEDGLDAAGDEDANKWLPQGEPQITTIELLAKSIGRPSIVAGELDDVDRQRLARKRVNVQLAPLNRCVRRPSVLAEIAVERLRAGNLDDPATLAPIYLHSAEAVAA